MIELQRVTKYFGRTCAVREVSLSVAAGELLVLVGGSGSGKTTTLKMINRLIEPTSGTVLIAGDDVAQLDPHNLRRQIGYVFQKVGLFPHLTVEENIGIALKLQGWEAARRRQRVAEVIELVELDSALLRRRPAELSGGQEQRVGVARALAAEPRLILLDEPFGALDPLTRDRLQQSFLGLRRKVGLTAILVTHDMGEALLLADRIGVMHAGQLVQIGSAAELLAAPADAYVERLLETPRRQAAAIQRHLAGAAG